MFLNVGFILYDIASIMEYNVEISNILPRLDSDMVSINWSFALHFSYSICQLVLKLKTYFWQRKEIFPDSVFFLEVYLRETKSPFLGDQSLAEVLFMA